MACLGWGWWLWWLAGGVAKLLLCAFLPGGLWVLAWRARLPCCFPGFPAAGFDSLRLTAPPQSAAGEALAEPAPGWSALMQRCWEDRPANRPAFPGACLAGLTWVEAVQLCCAGLAWLGVAHLCAAACSQVAGP